MLLVTSSTTFSDTLGTAGALAAAVLATTGARVGSLSKKLKKPPPRGAGAGGATGALATGAGGGTTFTTGAAVLGVDAGVATLSSLLSKKLKNPPLGLGASTGAGAGAFTTGALGAGVGSDFTSGFPPPKKLK